MVCAAERERGGQWAFVSINFKAFIVIFLYIMYISFYVLIFKISPNFICYHYYYYCYYYYYYYRYTYVLL